MVRIAEGEHPKDIRESNYFTESGDYSVGEQASNIMLNCLMYKMSYYRFGDIRVFFKYFIFILNIFLIFLLIIIFLVFNDFFIQFLIFFI